MRLRKEPAVKIYDRRFSADREAARINKFTPCLGATVEDWGVSGFVVKVKDKYLRTDKTFRNPGATWHEKEAESLHQRAKGEIHTGHAKYLRDMADAHNWSAVESARLGIPNPPKKRRRPRKKTMTPLLVVGGVLVAAYFLGRR